MLAPERTCRVAPLFARPDRSICAAPRDAESTSETVLQ